MGISRSHDKKSPTDNPTEFFKLNVSGTTHGTARSVPDCLPSGPMREQLMGNPMLSKPMDPSRTTRTGRTGGSENEGHGSHPVGPEASIGSGKRRN